MDVEKEGGCVGYGHAEVASVRTLDKGVMHNPLMTIGEIPCRSGQFGVFLIQVHQNKPFVKEGYSSHYLFKLPGLLLFAQKGGRGGRAGGTGTAGISLASSGSPSVVGSLRKENDGEFPVQLE